MKEIGVETATYRLILMSAVESGLQVYTDALLATQISYLQYLFDTKHALEMLSEERRFEAESVLTGHMETFKTVFKHTTGYLEKSARRYVTLESLF